MAMKQTQTKLFDFSDVGLDFCAGSKNLFPDRFKKMLAQGYNEQTVSSVAVAGNQVTLSYGVSHGYVADRVLKVNAPELLGINGGEFVIDSVTANTVTMTIDGAPTSITGNFTTKVASLGWSLEYELGQVHLYKMKYLDERDLYVRLVFPTIGTFRGSINVCVGKTANLSTGVITDENSIPEYRENLSVINGFEWQLNNQANTTSDNYSYSQGFSAFGRACIVGSQYHIVLMLNTNSTYGSSVYAVLPTALQKYDVLDYPIVIGVYNTNTVSLGGTTYQFQYTVGNSSIYVGKIHAAIDYGSNANFVAEQSSAKALSSFVSSDIDSFNTTLAYPISIFDKKTKQHIGFVAAGLYRFEARYGTSPTSLKQESPSTSMDIDLGQLLKIHLSYSTTTASAFLWFCAPIEEVKIAN